jgi:hypothetical protein
MAMECCTLPVIKETRLMRIVLALPLLLLGACNFANDATNDTVTLEYNQQRIEDAASDTAKAAREVASGVGNVAVSTGRAIGNEVGDIDVDVDVNRNRSGSGNSN